MKTKHYMSFLVFTLMMITRLAAQMSSACQFGYYLTPSNQCLECLTTCSKCKDLTSACAGCSEGERLNPVDGKCVSCGPGELQCGDTTACQPHYQMKNGMCRPVCKVQNCDDCDSIYSTKCKSCLTNFMLSPDATQCIAKTIRNLQT